MNLNENKKTEVISEDSYYDADLPDKPATDVSDFDSVASGQSEDDPKTDPEPPAKGEDGGNEDGGNGNDGTKSGEGEETPDGDKPKEGDDTAGSEDKPAAQDAKDVRVAKDGTLEIAEDARLVIDGKPVLHKELVKAFLDNSKFVAANTQKAMEIADARKAMDKDLLVINSYKGLVDAVKGSDDVLTSLKEHFSDKPDVLKAIDDAIKADPIEASKPYETELTALRTQNRQLKEEKLFSTERNDMIKKHQLSEEDMKGVEKIILDKYNATKIPLSLKDGYELWQAKQIIANSGKPKKPKPPESSADSPTISPKPKTRPNSYYDDERTVPGDFDGVSGG